MADIWSVVDTKTNKIEKAGFDKKQDAKALRNELNKPLNEKTKQMILSIIDTLCLKDKNIQE